MHDFGRQSDATVEVGLHIILDGGFPGKDPCGHAPILVKNVTLDTDVTPTMLITQK
jgi:hypothetical protein